MEQMRKKVTAVILSCAMLLSFGLSAFAENGARPEENLQARYIKDIVAAVSEQYRFEVTEAELYEAVIDYVMNENPELLEGAIRAATGDLDKYSGYFNREEMTDFGDYLDQNYVGIGIEIVRSPGYLEIAGVTPDSPAEKAGFAVGDRIIAIDGEDATGYNISMAAQKVRGEEGTSVTLTVLRGEEQLTITVQRAKISTATAAHQIVDGIGYLQIIQFNHTTSDEVKTAFAEFDAAGVKQMIVDVRDNPGGELSSVLKVLYQIVPEGMPLTTFDYNDDRRDVTFHSNAKFKTTDKSYAVLINEESASAAELFAGVIRDSGLGVVVGRRSLGKGTVQEFMGLNSLGGLELGDIKLTVAEYSLPSGEFIHKKGIDPDIKVKNRTTPLVTEEYAPMAFEAKYKVGDSGDGVLAIEQRLSGLGYQVGEIDGVFDAELELATYSFQEDAALFPYGVMDITTQTFLNNAANEAEVLVDLQLEAAFNYFKEKAGK